MRADPRRIRLTVEMNRRASSLRLLSGLLVSGLLLASCGDEANDREAFVRVMQEQGEVSLEQAECMADEVFNSDLTESQINQGAKADESFEGAERFQTVFEAALATCS